MAANPRATVPDLSSCTKVVDLVTTRCLPFLLNLPCFSYIHSFICLPLLFFFHQHHFKIKRQEGQELTRPVIQQARDIPEEAAVGPDYSHAKPADETCPNYTKEQMIAVAMAAFADDVGGGEVPANMSQLTQVDDELFQEDQAFCVLDEEQFDEQVLTTDKRKGQEAVSLLPGYPNPQGGA